MVARIDPGGAAAGVDAGNGLPACSGEPRADCLRLCGDVISGPITAIGAWHNDRLHRPGRRGPGDFTGLTEGSKTRAAAARAGEMDPAHPAGRRVARRPGIIARLGSGHKAGPARAERVERAVSRS